jgi:competence ComEA-like helix-hairpin-helix protein
VVYRRRELWLLLLLTVSLGAGLAVRELRTGFPDLADRLEKLDEEDPTAPASAPGSLPSLPAEPSRINAREKEPGAGDPAGPLDLNRASAEELGRLPGIGPTLAGQIVRARERRGRFASLEDLRAVPGIGPKKFDGIRDLVSVELLEAGGDGPLPGPELDGVEKRDGASPDR